MPLNSILRYTVETIRRPPGIRESYQMDTHNLKLTQNRSIMQETLFPSLENEALLPKKRCGQCAILLCIIPIKQRAFRYILQWRPLSLFILLSTSFSLGAELPAEKIENMTAGAWFLKGLNDFEEGKREQLQKKAALLFERAIESFGKVEELEKERTPLRVQGVKYLALSYAHLPGEQNARYAWQLLVQLMEDPDTASLFEDPNELSTLCGLSVLQQTDKKVLRKTKDMLGSIKKEEQQKIWGWICMGLGEWEEAETHFCLMEASYPHLTSELSYWRGYCAEKRGCVLLKKNLFRKLWKGNPGHKYASVAYFNYYSWSEYVEGKPEAIRHIQAMTELYPSTPLLVATYYLTGLYYTNRTQYAELSAIQKKNLMMAIEHYASAEKKFDSLFASKEIPPSQISYFMHIRSKAKLERAIANLLLAQKTKKGEKEVYLSYAEEVLQELIADFSTPGAKSREFLIQTDGSYPKVWAQGEFFLSKVYQEKKEWQLAEKLLNKSLKRCEEAGDERKKEEALVWMEKGKIDRHHGRLTSALDCFVEANKKIGVENERFALWMEQSLCYKDLKQLGAAMQLLSQIINEDAPSPLRLQAMFLRGEIYKLQGRPELALKQWKAAILTGVPSFHQIQQNKDIAK